MKVILSTDSHKKISCPIVENLENTENTKKSKKKKITNISALSRHTTINIFKIYNYFLNTFKIGIT